MRKLGVLGAVAFTLAGSTAAFAMQSARSSNLVSYHLMQISVEADQMSVDDFRAETQSLTSCGDARKLAKRLKADSKQDRFVRSSTLPKALQDELSQLDPGQATQVFSADKSVMRVIIMCGRV